MSRLALVIGLCALLAPGEAGALSWHSVPDGSSLQFVVRFEGSEAQGVFRHFDVVLDLGGPEEGDESLIVDVDITSADMFSAELNEGLAEPAWFHFDRFPEARYTSHTIEKKKGQQYVAAGTLQLKGVQRTVAVPFEWHTQARRGRLHGSVVLRRNQFGIGSGEWADDDSIGGNVRVEFDVAMAPQD